MSTIDNISSNDRFSRYGLFIDDLDPVPSEDMKILGENSNRSSFNPKRHGLFGLPNTWGADSIHFGKTYCNSFQFHFRATNSISYES